MRQATTIIITEIINVWAKTGQQQSTAKWMNIKKKRRGNNIFFLYFLPHRFHFTVCDRMFFRVFITIIFIDVMCIFFLSSFSVYAFVDWSMRIIHVCAVLSLAVLSTNSRRLTKSHFYTSGCNRTQVSMNFPTFNSTTIAILLDAYVHKSIWLNE